MSATLLLFAQVIPQGHWLYKPTQKLGLQDTANIYSFSLAQEYKS
jgi:hypothetical protein